VMMDAASSDGRPFGVQLLVVGRSAISRELELYTVDPSGGWRSHVGSAVVGRGAERVRDSMLRKNSSGDKDVEKRGWKLALESAMMAAVDTFEVNEQVSLDTEENKSSSFGAIAVFGLGAGRNRAMILHSSSRCAAVHPNVVESMYRDCFRRLRDKKLITSE
jgi:hypothetical protein